MGERAHVQMGPFRKTKNHKIKIRERAYIEMCPSRKTKLCKIREEKGPMYRGALLEKGVVT